jgi:hypothetical protein
MQVSEATRDAVEEAIRAHIADEADGPRVLTDWYVIAAAVGDDDELTHYEHITTDAPWHVLTGLAHCAWRRLSTWADE